MKKSPYNTDFVLWTERQADALRRHATGEIDWDNVAEEIETLGRKDKREILSRLVFICENLLQWQSLPKTRLASWRSLIIVERDKIADLIKESPSLTDYPGQRLHHAYASARQTAMDEMQTDLPTSCPWTIAQILDPDFWPEG